MAGTRRELDRCSCDLAMDSRLGHAYNEEAFRYLLGVHQRRSERSNRPFLLLLVDLKEQPGLSVRIEPPVARRLFAALWRALRDADVIGWYREEQIAGAVLTEFSQSLQPEISHLIGERVGAALSVDLPESVAPRVQIRVCQIQPRLKS